MVRVVVITGLVLAVIVGSVVLGCGPRAEVATKKVLDQLDKVLGELDVKRAKIKQSQEKIDNKLAELRERRIGAEVRLELFEKKKTASEEELSKARANLEKLKGIAKEAEASDDGTVVRNGKTFTAEQIGNTAADLSKKFAQAKTKVESIQVSIDAMTRSVNFVRAQEKAAKDMMVDLNNKISEIDSKKTAVDAVRQATILSGDDKSILDDINALSKEIEDMFVDVEVALKTEEEKLNEMQSDTSSADELLSEPTDLGGVVDDIDALLGTGAEKGDGE